MICLRCKIDKPVTEYDRIRMKNGSTGERRLKKCCRPCCKDFGWKVGHRIALDFRDNRRGEDYASRDVILRKMGFANYKEYLASDLWRQIRARVYAKWGDRCFMCKSRATELHHNRYHEHDLYGMTLKFIFPICRNCHSLIEFREDGSKASLEEAKESIYSGKKHYRNNKGK